jgi:hypothetical protein
MTLTPATGNGGQLERPPQGPQPPMRASDTERDAVAQVLRQAVTHGMLTLDECDERLVAAYGARFRDELPPLTADLPPVAAAPPVAPGWQGLAVLTLLQVRAALTTMPGAPSCAPGRGRPPSSRCSRR